MDWYNSRKYHKKFESSKAMKIFLSICWEFRALIWAPIAFLFALEAVQIVGRVIISLILTGFSLKSAQLLALVLIAIMIYDFIVLFLDIMMVKYVIVNIAYLLWEEITMKVIRHIEKLGDTFATSMAISKIVSRVNGAEKIKDMIETFCWRVFNNAFQVILATIALGIIIPWSLPIIFLCFGLFFRFNTIMRKKQMPFGKRRKDMEETGVGETRMRIISTLITLMLNSSAGPMVEKLQRGFYKLRRVGKLELKHILTGSGILRDITLYWGRRSLLSILVVLTLFDMMTVPTFVMVFTIVETSFIAVWGIVDTLHRFDHESETIVKFFELMQLKPVFEEPTVSKDLPCGPLSFVLENVSFTYPKMDMEEDKEDYDKEILTKRANRLRKRRNIPKKNNVKKEENGSHLCNISMEIKAGEKIALVGSSGAGKSTLTKLLTKLQVPGSGRILVNGINIMEIHGNELRKRLALVPQGTSIDIFNETMSYNVSIENGFDEDTVIEALEASALWPTVCEWDNLIYELIGERGRSLSGGQQQRTAIARAFARRPDFIILDEATSALDTLTERQIQNSLETLLEGRTALIIAHRLSTLKHCDKVVVMDNGCIVEVGTWDELKIKEGGLFRKLLEAQDLH